jgi:hypothetical protein
LRTYCLILFLGISQIALGQNCLYLGVGKEIISAQNLNFTDSKPFQAQIGYQNLAKKLGFSLLTHLESSEYKREQILSQIVNDSKFKDQRSTSVSNLYFGMSLGPNLNFEFNEEIRFRFSGSFNYGVLNSWGNYSDRRDYLTPIDNNRFVTSSSEILSSQKQYERVNTHFTQIAFGVDLLSSMPVGLEIGWQNLDYGKTMNQLKPTGKYANETLKTKTNIWYATLCFFVSKRKD